MSGLTLPLLRGRMTTVESWKCTKLTGRFRNDSLYTYPYGPEAGRPIEYRSSYGGGVVTSGQGLNATQDNDWLDDFRAYDKDFEPTATDATRYLPPMDGEEVVARDYNSTMDQTDIFNPNGSYLRTELWTDDTFWPPACAVMTDELARLQANADGVDLSSEAIEVALKHYAASLPNANNHSNTVWTYIHVIVHSVGSQPAEVFGQSCVDWYSGLVGASIYQRPALRMPWTDFDDDNGRPYHFANGSVLKLPPKIRRATSGGVRVVQGQDLSIFGLWVVPNFEF